jgi:hypothetical protein
MKSIDGLNPATCRLFHTNRIRFEGTIIFLPIITGGLIMRVAKEIISGKPDNELPTRI